MAAWGITDYLTLVIIILTTYVVHFYFKYITRVNPLPGPLPFPFVGNLPQILWNGGNYKKFFDHNRKKYGDIFDIYLGTSRNVTLNRAEYAEKILTPAKGNKYFLNLHPDEYKKFDEFDYVGTGLHLNHNYDSWKFNTKFFTQALLSPKLIDRSLEVMNEIAKELDEYWHNLYVNEENLKGNKNILNFPEWSSKFANDLIVKLITGERSYTMAAYYNTQSDVKADHPKAVVDDSVKLVKAVHKFLVGLFFFRSVPALIRHYVPGFKSISDDIISNVRFMNQKLDSLVKRRRQEIENTPLDQPLRSDMLTLLIIANTPRDTNYKKIVGDETMKPMSDRQIRGNIFDGWVGGSNTTANTIAFIVYYLEHYPDVKQKVLKEIDDVFQDDRTRPITVNDHRKLKYCESVAKETLRICPPISTFSRCSEYPDEIAGYNWPAGTTFRINNDAMHLGEVYWGADANKFNPDRWFVEGFEPTKYSFNVFGGGLRPCPGRKLAIIELVTLMSLLFRKYEFELVDMKAPLKLTASFINACDELLVRIKPKI